MENQDLKNFIRDVIEEEFSPKAVEVAAKWHGGVIKLETGNDTQGKEIPFEVFFKKILSVRDSLRVLEQKLNTNKSLSNEDKTNYQAYITKAYGALTSFNILFKEGKDKFVGAGGGGKSSAGKEQMTLKQARDKLGLNEY